jgi:acyl dehydratase
MTSRMLKPGDTYEKNIVFTQEDVHTFARLTGDYNPIHFDV